MIDSVWNRVDALRKNAASMQSIVFFETSTVSGVAKGKVGKQRLNSDRSNVRGEILEDCKVGRMHISQWSFGRMFAKSAGFLPFL